MKIIVNEKIKLNKRERYLLILLGTIIFFYFFQKTIFAVQKERIRKLEKQKNKYQEENIEIDKILNEKEKIKENSIRLSREKDRIYIQYFSSLEQSQIIYVLDELLNESKLKILDINFSKPELETENGVSINTMNISILFKGNYEYIIECLKKIKSNPKKILITNIIINSENDDILTGEIGLKLYSLENILNVKENTVSMNSNLNSERKNPFSPIKKNDEGMEILVEDNLINSEEENKIYMDDIVKKSGNNSKVNKNIFNNIQYVQKEYIKEYIPETKSSEGKEKTEKKPEEQKKYKDNSSKYEKQFYIDLSKRNIIINCSENDMIFWIYSCDNLDTKIKLVFLDNKGNKIYIESFEKVTSNEWKCVEFKFPENKFSYPLKLDKIYFELENNIDKSNFIFIDGIDIKNWD